MNTHLPTVFLLLSWVVVPLSLYLEFVLGADLFSRSGSLMVLFAAIAEYQLLRVRDSHHSEQLQTFSEGGRVAFRTFHPSRGHQRQESLAHVSVVLGTLIWGYGTLLL